MVKPKSIAEIAGILIEIYKKSFMKKQAGDYVLTKDLFREIIVGRKSLNLANIIVKVHLDLLEDGYILIDLGDSLLICNKKQISRQRKVPRSVVLEYIYFIDDDDCGIITEADIEAERKNLDKYL